MRPAPNHTILSERAMNNLGKAVFAVLCAATGLCAASLLSGCANSRNTNTSSSRSTSGSLMVTMESGTYMIKPGDAVELSVLGYDEFRTSTTVKESGSIIVPVLGEIHAAGLSKRMPEIQTPHHPDRRGVLL